MQFCRSCISPVINIESRNLVADEAKAMKTRHVLKSERNAAKKRSLKLFPAYSENV